MQVAPKSVLITGASRGLGLELVKQLTRVPNPPKHIFALCRTPEKADELQKMAKANNTVKVMKLDVNELDSLPDVELQVSGIVGDEGLNLLINNAGINLRGTLQTVTEKSMLESLKINTVAPLMVTQALIPLLRKAAATVSSGLSAQRAMILNMSSLKGSIEKTPNGVDYDYRASKCALNMITKSLSVDLSKEGILVMSVHPGWVQTDMGGPRGDITTPESVSGMIKLIASASEKHSGTHYDYKGDVVPW